MINLENKKVLITGAGSLIMREVTKSLQKRGAIVQEIYHDKLNLLNEEKTLRDFFYLSPDYAIMGAGFNGGLQFNSMYPAEIYYRTTLMGLHSINCANLCGVKKIVNLITSCAYAPAELLKEENFLNGEVHPSVECHGFAKRNLFIYGKQLNKQYKTNIIGVVLNNCYGPGPEYTFSEARGKFVNSLIKKFIDAKKNNGKVTLWGTGEVKREIIYSEDAAEGIVCALEKYEDVNFPINVGWGLDYTIKEIAEQIKELTEYDKTIFWDTTKSNGQIKKLLDVTKMKEILEFQPKIGLKEGLKKTIEYYKENYDR